VAAAAAVVAASEHAKRLPCWNVNIDTFGDGAFAAGLP
jgi:hypothetical protein